MLGAVVGDIIGSTYEFHNTKSMGFELFEEVIRLAISLGGDSDTIGAMAGAIAACVYSVNLSKSETFVGFWTCRGLNAEYHAYCISA